MLKKATWITVCSFLIVMGGMIALPFVQSGQEEVSLPANTRPHVHQLKVGVRKDAYLTRPDGRFHTQILAQSSTVEAKPVRRSYYLTEMLHDIRCRMDEEDNQVRYLQAPRGVYVFNTQTFTTQTAQMQLFKNEEQVLDGIAKAISIRFKGGCTHFDASQVKLKVQDIHALSLESQTTL